MLKIDLRLDILEVKACMFGLQCFMLNERDEYREKSHSYGVGENLLHRLRADLKGVTLLDSIDSGCRIRVLMHPEEFGLLQYIAQTIEGPHDDPDMVGLRRLGHTFRSVEQTVYVTSGV